MSINFLKLAFIKINLLKKNPFISNSNVVPSTNGDYWPHGVIGGME